MRAIIQRVSSASVSVAGEIIGSIEEGLVVLLGIEANDSPQDLDWLAEKIVAQRLFGAWDQSVVERGGGILLISQFTLHASTRKGTKPSWHRAAKPDIALPLYETMAGRLSALLGGPIQTGKFGAAMQVTLTNDGPVTVMLDSKLRE